MATTSISTTATPDRVLDLLRRADVYPRWVVGTRRLLDAEDGWPAPGTTFKHEVGVGPLRIRDRTRLVADDGDGRIVLEARARPLGRARVELRVRADGAGTTIIEIDEFPVSGPARFVPRLVLDPVTRVRNKRGLQRLRSIAEHDDVT